MLRPGGHERLASAERKESDCKRRVSNGRLGHEESEKIVVEGLTVDVLHGV